MREPPRPISYDGALGRQIIDLHVWAVRQGLLGIDAAALFDGLCERLVIAVEPLWRAFAGMRTLHPQWGGYGYTWWRDRNSVQPEQFERGSEYEQNFLTSPFSRLLGQTEDSAKKGEPWRHLRRRLVGPEAQLDFPILEALAAAGAALPGSGADVLRPAGVPLGRGAGRAALPAAGGRGPELQHAARRRHD